MYREFRRAGEWGGGVSGFLGHGGCACEEGLRRKWVRRIVRHAWGGGDCGEGMGVWCVRRG